MGLRQLTQPGKPMAPATTGALYSGLTDTWAAGGYDAMWEQAAEFICQRARTAPEVFSGWIANLGSRGNRFNLDGTVHVHVDLNCNFDCPRQDCVVAGDIDRPLFASNAFDAVLCVGSVINYCNLIAVFDNIRRMMKPRGRLIVEFETSLYASTPHEPTGNLFKIKKNTYAGKDEVIWLYHPKTVVDLLSAYGLTVLAFRALNLAESNPPILDFSQDGPNAVTSQLRFRDLPDRILDGHSIILDLLSL